MPPLDPAVAAQASGQQAGAAEGAGQQGGGPAMGGAAPASQPQEAQGLKRVAATNVALAMKLLTQAISVYPPTSDEGKGVLKALTALSSKFGKAKDEELVPAQIMQMAMAQRGGQQAQQAQKTPPTGIPEGGAAAQAAGAM